MPIPKKRQGEKQKDFMMRCVPQLMKYHKKDQAIAMCYDAFQGSVELESYNDYPQGAVNNAKRALKWAEKNGWGSCGEATGKKRASQIATKQNITMCSCNTQNAKHVWRWGLFGPARRSILWCIYKIKKIKYIYIYMYIYFFFIRI